MFNVKLCGGAFKSERTLLCYKQIAFKDKVFTNYYMINLKNVSVPIRLLIILILAFLLLMLVYETTPSNFCNTIVFCESIPSRGSPSVKPTVVFTQYEIAIKDMDAGRYDIAQKRFEYILSIDPENLGAKQKLAEVENFLTITPTP